MLIYMFWSEREGYKKIRIKNQTEVNLWSNNGTEMYPDLEDWATCGILLGKIVEEMGEAYLNLVYNKRDTKNGSWILSSDKQEPLEIWDNFGGIVAATLLFLWDGKEPLL